MDNRKIEDLVDVMLYLDDPDFAEKFRVAIGAQPGETVEMRGPQFNRTDGITPAVLDVVFSGLHLLPDETLKAIGCAKWDEPDSEGRTLWLFPAEWYDHIPDGLDIVDINGDIEKFERGVTDDDHRFGMLAFGFYKGV